MVESIITMSIAEDRTGVPPTPDYCSTKGLPVGLQSIISQDLWLTYTGIVSALQKHGPSVETGNPPSTRTTRQEGQRGRHGRAENPKDTCPEP